MRHQVMDIVVLDRDVPEHGLRAGDLGAVVEVYGSDGLEVEFVTASGATAAVITIKEGDMRSVAAGDLLSVRRLGRSA